MNTAEMLEAHALECEGLARTASVSERPEWGRMARRWRELALLHRQADWRIQQARQDRATQTRRRNLSKDLQAIASPPLA
jgi:hypothetical protein